MEKPIKNLSEFDLNQSKEALETEGLTAAHQILENGYSPLKTYVALKKYTLYLETLLEELKTPALEEVLQFGEKTFRCNGATVRQTHRRKWDFTEDATWHDIKVAIDKLQTDRKAQEDILKNGENAENFLRETEVSFSVILTEPQTKSR